MRWKNTSTPTFAGSAGSAGKASIVETMQLLDDDGNECAVFTKAVDGVKSATVGGNAITATQLANLVTYGNPTGVKVYRALLTQTGTDNPTAIVLENTLGGTVVWTYNLEGNYRGTLTNAFPQSRTWANMQDLFWDGIGGNTILPSADGNYLVLNIVAGDGFLGVDSPAYITIRVYP